MAKQRVLVVDDETTICRVLQRFLTKRGCDVTGAGSVEEAVGHLGKEPFACALVDIVLPGRSGLSLLAEIKERSSDTEVVMMTSHASVSTALEAIRNGAYDYLTKPFEELDEVWITLRRALTNRELRLRNGELAAETQLQNEQLLIGLKRQAALIEAGRAMASFDSFDELLDFFVGLVAEELDVERASLMLLDEDSEILRLVAARGIDGPSEDFNVMLGEGVAGKVALEGKPLLVRDAKSDPRIDREPRPDLSDSFVCAPISLTVPIKSRNRVLGVINATNRRSDAEFDEGDLDFLAGMTGQLAVAVERARQVDQLSRAYISLQNAQEQLLFSERNKAFSQIASGVAHDFNNTLSVIAGRTELAMLRLKQDDTDTGEVTMDLELIAKAAMQSAETIRRIQQFTRQEPKKDGRLVALDRVVRDAVDINRPKWESQAGRIRAPIEVTTALTPELSVLGDPNDLIQALSNLIFNAVEAMPDGGTIAIRSGREDGATWVEVTDSGVGMDATQIKRLFEPYFTTKEGGHGLGTSIVFGIVERNGGKILVQSELGRGTTMRLEFPNPDETGKKAPEKTCVAPEQRRVATILLIDDDRHVRETYRCYLELHGHKVQAFASGAAALECLTADGFDVVLTDLAMPGMSGLEFATQARAKSPKTPVIMVTGCVDPISAADREDAGIDRVLAKPCLNDGLLEAIDACVEDRETVTANAD